MADLACKQENKSFFCGNFCNQRTCVSNSRALTLTQPKIQISKLMATCGLCTNKYAKEKLEKEKNTTILAIYHGPLLSDYGRLFMEQIDSSLSKNQALIS